uniref:Uncharacterized protein n=1 Tax=Salmo trutta TaxID=8032 RepID=A0A673VQS3_SALTR
MLSALQQSTCSALFTQIHPHCLTRTPLFQTVPTLHEFEGHYAVRKNYSGKHKMRKKYKTVRLCKNKPTEAHLLGSSRQDGVVTISVHVKPGSEQNALTAAHIVYEPN